MMQASERGGGGEGKYPYTAGFDTRGGGGSCDCGGGGLVNATCPFFEATKILKNEMKYETPVVALTAETGADVRERCKEVGFDEFVQKPLKGELLKTILSKFCSHVVQ